MKLADLSRTGRNTTGRFHLYGVGDLHADSATFNAERLQAFIAHIAADPLAVAVCVGDYLEGRTPGMRHYDPEAIRDDFRSHQHEYVNYGLDVVEGYLKPLVKAKVPTVLVRGNHDAYLDQVDFTAMLAQRLGPTVRYMGDEGFVRVKSGNPRTSGQGTKSGLYSTILHVAHGAGGGMRPGGKVNRLQQTFEWVDGVDVVVAGHTHDGFARVFPGIGVHERKDGALGLAKRDRALLRAPAFVERGVEATMTYASRKQYPSNDRGLLYLAVCPKDHRIWRHEVEL